MKQNQVVCVVVLGVQRDKQRLLVGMKYESLSTITPGEDKIKLGQVSAEPKFYAAALKARERDIPYSVFMEKTSSFINPTGVEQLTEELGVSFKAGSSTLFAGMINDYDPGTTAAALRKEQTTKMALAFVSKGVDYFKAGNNIESFQCLNKALSIDKDNVEALVARGALYANNGSLEKAIIDFEAGLAIKSEHKNARKYICETLVALGRNHEDAKKYNLALETFEKVLKYDSNHYEAKEGAWIVQQKLMGVPPEMMR